LLDLHYIIAVCWCI